MKRVGLTLGLLLLAAPALAEEGPFDGRWGIDAEACATAPGTSDIVPTEIRDGIIEHYESTCEITGVTPIGEEPTSAWRATLTCSGEGEVWGQDAIFAIAEPMGDRPRQLVEIHMDTGAVILRRACE